MSLQSVTIEFATEVKTEEAREKITKFEKVNTAKNYILDLIEEAKFLHTKYSRFKTSFLNKPKIQKSTTGSKKGVIQEIS